MEKETFTNEYFYEIIGRYYAMISIFEHIVEETKKKHKFGASSLDIDYITISGASGIEIHFKSKYKLTVNFFKVNSWLVVSYENT